MREITTPNLPGFITISLNLINGKATSGPPKPFKELPLLNTVLSAFVELIGRHPTIFRPFVSQLQKLLLSILASPTASSYSSSKAVQLAQELFVALHHCAPKNTSGEQWANDSKNTIASIHQCADHLFRSVNEQWESSDPNFKHKKRPKDLSELPQDNESDALGLPPWQSLPTGAIRVTILLGLLEKFVSIRTASVINYPLGAIMDLTSRLMSVTVPKTKEDSAQSNSEFSRDERAALYIELPRIHTSCIDLFRTIVAAFGTGSTSVVNAILEQNLWVFEAESFNSSLRESSYLLVSEILPFIGRSLAKENVLALSPIIRQCCRDLVPADISREAHETKNALKGSSKDTQINMNVDTLLNLAPKEPGSKGTIRELESVAMTLLPLLYNYLPSEFVPLPIRTEMERIAILTANRSAMVASVMNPIPPIKGRRPIPSILPFLTRRYSRDLEVECLIHPRMPVIAGNTSDYIDAEDYEEKENSEQTEVLATPSVSTQDISLNMIHNRQPKDTAPASPPTTQNKRILPVDSEVIDQKNFTQPQKNSEQIFSQSKKARLELDEMPAISSSVPMTVSEVTPSSPVISFVAAPLVSSVAASNAPTLTSIGTNIRSPEVQKLTSDGATADAHDSDDEMPTLDIEPDTDEEDE